LCVRALGIIFVARENLKILPTGFYALTDDGEEHGDIPLVNRISADHSGRAV
jgi:hypothetical protein